MKQPTAMDNIESRIKELEFQYEQQIADIKFTASALMESVSPMHLLKSTLRNVATTPGLRGNILDTVIGLGAGFLGKKLFVTKSSGMFRKLTGSALQLLLTNFISKKLHNVREENPEG